MSPVSQAKAGGWTQEFNSYSRAILKEVEQVGWRGVQISPGFVELNILNVETGGYADH